MATFDNWADAHDDAVDFANLIRRDVCIRKVKEWGKTRFVVGIASVDNPGEIVAPGTPKALRRLTSDGPIYAE